MAGVRRSHRLGALAVVLLLALTACGSSSGSAAKKPASTTKLQGLQQTPAPDVSTLALPDVTTGQDLPFKAQPGQLLLVYFGYTSCPDICPGTLAGIKLALHKIGPDASKVAVAMATVDPERDTGPVLTDYLSHFFKTSHALRTDDPTLLKTVADGFGVQYEVAKNAKGEEEVGHSSLVFAVDENGKIIDAWPFGMSETVIASDLEILLAKVGSAGASS